MRKYLIIILIIVFFCGGIFLPRDPFSKEKTIFRIEKGQSSKEIALNLQKEGFLLWSPFFRAYILISGKTGKLQAGSYFLSSSMNIPQIVQKLVLGDVAEAKITIPEGFTSNEIYQKLQGVTSPDLVLLQNNEGYLFPDTYQIPYGTPTEDIVRMMRDNFNKKTAGLKITPEVVVMASFLEKEIKTTEDKKLVSGILWKRLRAGVPLQVDAAPETYKRLGLPEGPICNPGLESIKAALNPKDSQFWYYLSTPEGETIFSKILDEHNTAKAKYLK